MYEGDDDDALFRLRAVTTGLALDFLTNEKQLRTAILGIIQRASSSEQLQAIGEVIVETVLVSNPRHFRQNPENGKWSLRNPPKGKGSSVIPFPPTAG